MKKAKLVHDNLNAGGGSERLAFVTLELLNQLDYEVDLATFHVPDLKYIEKNFGNDASHLWKFNHIEVLDAYSLFGINEKITSLTDEDNIKTLNIHTENEIEKFNDYDLIINTHGDLFAYHELIKIKDENSFYQENTSQKCKILQKDHLPIQITYCHYPLVPNLVKNNDYTFLSNFFKNYNEFSSKTKEIFAYQILRKYNQMMNNTVIVTNSEFSKREIKKIYGDNVIPSIIYPPVEVEKFQTMGMDKKSINDNNESSYRNNQSILVVSRISKDKKIENAINILKRLKEKGSKNNYNMTVIGNILPRNKDYLEELLQMIKKYDLNRNIEIKSNASFNDLKDIANHSSIYIHPTPAEPFGISIVEAMSAGLIPVAPSIGGNTEFVPLKYQYNSFEHAAQIITKVIEKDKENLETERHKLRFLATKFSKSRYKENLLKLFEKTVN